MIIGSIGAAAIADGGEFVLSVSFYFIYSFAVIDASDGTRHYRAYCCRGGHCTFPLFFRYFHL
jgi:hypothetical protein